MGITEVPTLSVTVGPHGVEKGWYVQGQILVTVRIAAKYPFEALDFQMPELEGAEVVVVQPPRLRKVNSYAGAGYILERVLAVFPRKPGTFRIPAMRARGMVMDEKKTEIRFDSRTDAIDIPISDIPPGYPYPWWMVSNKVVVTEKWSKPPDTARQGEVLRRTVTVAAFGVTADRVRMPEHGRSRNTQAVEVGTWSETKKTSTGVIGKVIRSWDIKILSTGIVYISPISLGFLDPIEQVARKSAVRGYRIEPLPPDSDRIARRLMAEARAAHDGNRAVAFGLLAMLLFPLLVLAGAGAWAMIPGRADRRLQRACRDTSDPRDIYRAVEAWRDEAQVASPELEATVRKAGAALFAQGAQAPNGRALARDLCRQARILRVMQIGARLRDWLQSVLGKRQTL